MTTTRTATYATLAERLISLGMISPDTAQKVLDEAVDRHEELDGEELSSALTYFGVAIAVYAESVEDEDLESAYASMLDEAAECTGGTMTIGDVTLTTDSDGSDLLRFVCNGETIEWLLEHDWGGLDHMGIWDQMHYLDPGNGKAFLAVEQEQSGESIYVLATDEQARALIEEFGVRLELDKN
ncbi:hypothetical protein GV794_07990 [Nocardia cyriacigeorgica]|uniref:SMI1/KNR4 family protein n=1 Tax=Nocardia cyriacigeorgica TaxID=135487 RepID=A0ABX0CJ25_9NOCA|nr:hypothetical protein [Nocardia cyriacigeorgica]NEW55593.1 hypothetical protein [Nocardia cyriacigeorgica]